MRRITVIFIHLTALALVLAALAMAPLASASPSAAIALDPSFGTGGLASGTSSIPNFQEAVGVAVAPDQDVLVAGEDNSAPGETVVRCLPDGSLDPSYGGGRGYVEVPGALGGANALSVDSAGSAALLSQRLTITKITASGEIDTAFGADGSVQVPELDPRLASLHLWSLVALPDGGVIAAGIPFVGGGMEAIELLPDGALDPSFGDGGVVLLGFGRRQKGGALQVTVQPNGDVLLAGSAEGRPALARLLPDGSPDPSFGHRGRVVAPARLQGRATSIATKANGAVLVAGAGGPPGNSTGLKLILLRYGPRGRLDESFGSNGISIDAAAEGAEPVALLPTRLRILVVTQGRGPAVRAFSSEGLPGASLAGVTGVPEDQSFDTAAALQGNRLILAATEEHPPAEDRIDLERFLVSPG